MNRHRARTPRAKALLAGAFAALTAALAIGATQLSPASTEVHNVANEESAAQQNGQWLTGYWHNFDNGSTVMPLSAIPSEYNLVAVAFADNHPSLDGGITFNLAGGELGGYTDARFRADIAAIQAEGRKVIISVGGELGNVIVSNPTQARNFADTTYALMRDYGFDGVDIDLEHGINAQYMTDALRDLHGQAGDDLIIAMAPQTIDFQAPSMGYYRLASNISDILTIVNMQYYNSGTMMGCDQKVYAQGTPDFVAALACIQLEMGLEPSQVGLGLPAVPSAAGGGYMAPSQIVRALDCLEAGTNCGSFSPDTPYGPIGGVMTWSINWDATNGYAFANTISDRLASGPGGGVPTDPPTEQPTPEPGDCTAPAWKSGDVYTGGNVVSHKGSEWRAQWWTRGEEPGTTGEWGVWRLVAAC
ncbi:glycosyl hydrolase family 18 protein [Nocardiopsis sp. N85]|uniref:glycosyl hydrolase family 18 protein n=1 Tax=Nocardiopsis sp. N85 TaxID=3029400 RepID=UPI00237F6DE1|nr:glycosyl hydrolase family 18 protein [Nocardiopsis sp. N85]MDE3721040.1 glycosyl hydrolase family 18 protein [Nocardiopsis sp. N85]